MGVGSWEFGVGSSECGEWGVWEDGDIIVKLMVVNLLTFGNFLLLTSYSHLPPPTSHLSTFN